MFNLEKRNLNSIRGPVAKMKLIPIGFEAIGLPKEKVCTHSWDGTSHFLDNESKRFEVRDGLVHP